jgi:phage baseplate assembly protein W
MTKPVVERARRPGSAVLAASLTPALAMLVLAMVLRALARWAARQRQAPLNIW